VTLGKPLLLIDVDGVLLPWGECPPGYSEQTMQTVREPEQVFWSPENASYLRVLAKVYAPVWCTARCEEVCSTVAALHGIGGDWPVLDLSAAVFRHKGRLMIRRGVSPKATWKLNWVRAYVAKRPFAWIDDDLKDDAYEWVKRRVDIGGSPGCLVKPDPNQGMRYEHFEDLMAFADVVQELRLAG
jgi:hypothetical protein